MTHLEKLCNEAESLSPQLSIFISSVEEKESHAELLKAQYYS